MHSCSENGGLGALVDYNPIYHLLEIVRAPLLRGEWPTAANFAMCGAAAACLLRTGRCHWPERRTESHLLPMTGNGIRLDNVNLHYSAAAFRTVAEGADHGRLRGAEREAVVMTFTR